MVKKYFSFLVALFVAVPSFANGGIFIEAETFAEKGGWKVDQQFMDVMGSPYLLAHGMGVPVEDASTTVSFPSAGTYHVYVRTYNWTSPWHDGEGPGKFMLLTGKSSKGVTLGAEGSEWHWQSAGTIKVKDLDVSVRLHDLTGFDGRVDAIYFTTDPTDIPPSDVDELEAFRRRALGIPAPEVTETYDLVVAGAGIAGMCAAISAARLGCKVALVNDRPVLGGNNSSEIRVHLGGRLNAGMYPMLGNLVKEFGPSKGGNAQPAANYEDEKKDAIIAAEENITLYPCYRVIGADMEGDRISSMLVKHIETGKEISIKGNSFADCTGDGTLGALAGAHWVMGREGKADYYEPSAPDVADSLTLGASVQWYSKDNGTPTKFPEFHYGIEFTEESYQKVKMGEWTWETGLNVNQITKFEQIRDYGMLVIYSNWSFIKNHLKDNKDFVNRSLDWVAYISGKRESRRLLGDYVLTENDIMSMTLHEDASAATTWSIDLHYPDPKNSEHFKDREFKTICVQDVIHPYPVPYRCLYSRNVNNLFMAGRDISVTHIALGTTRVMRTTGMLGEVVGMAASICKKHNATPRDVYQLYLPELRALMEVGVGDPTAADNQQYNLGGTLGDTFKTKK